MSKVVPVILSGGSGTRLWPMSRPERPKQLLALTAAETMLQLTAGRVAGERFDLIGGLSIGRSREADVQIEDRYASGVHARIFSREGRSYVEDMNSTNGTMLNDATLKGEAELLDGDVVRIGDTEFTTAMFPREDTWFLPLKVAVRRAEDVDLGQVVDVRMQVGR